jgi:hypothetical protein
MVLLPARSVPLVKEIAMTSLRLRMMEDMQVRNLSQHTQDSYLLRVSQLARHFARSPDSLGPEEIHAYQVYLTNEKKLAPRSVQVTVAALRLLYRVTLGLDWISTGSFRAQRRRRHWPSFSAPRRCCTSLAASRASNTTRS